MCRCMGDDALAPREGERIPRRALPDFEEVDTGLFGGIFQFGWKIWKVALDDRNQYGPHAMILLLLLMATFTGLMLKILELLSN